MAGRGRAWWLAGLAGLLALAVLRAWDPATAGVQVCVFRAVFDLPCPGCGLTRASAYLARGSWQTALEVHPLAPVVGAEAVLVWLSWGVVGRARCHRFVSEHAGPLVLANAVPLLALWLGRMATGSLPF